MHLRDTTCGVEISLFLVGKRNGTFGFLLGLSVMSSLLKLINSVNRFAIDGPDGAVKKSRAPASDGRSRRLWRTVFDGGRV